MPQNFSAVNGPLAALELPGSSSVESFYYPANLTSVTNHYVRFDAYSFKDSRYQHGIAGPQIGAVDPGAQVASALTGLLTTPFGFVLPGTGLSALNTGPGITTAALNYLNANGGQSLYQNFPGLRGIGNKILMNHIYLYTPDTLQFTYKDNWETVSLREEFGLLATAVSAGSDIMNGSGAGAAFMAGQQAIGKLASMAGISGVEKGLSTFAQTQGTPINPITETLFRDISPRSFQFEFKLYPQSQAETEQIYNVVQQFIFHAAGEFATSDIGGFLLMPSVFDIKFMFLARSPDGTTHEIENPWIRRISTCALEDIIVDYAPEGQWMAQQDGAPTGIRMQLMFKELQLVTKADVARGF